MKSVFHFSLSVLFCACLSGPASANLLLNSGFESGTVSGNGFGSVPDPWIATFSLADTYDDTGVTAMSKMEGFGSLSLWMESPPMRVTDTLESIHPTTDIPRMVSHKSWRLPPLSAKHILFRHTCSPITGARSQASSPILGRLTYWYPGRRAYYGWPIGSKLGWPDLGATQSQFCGR